MEFIVTIQEPEIQVVYVATQGEQGVHGLIWIDAGWTDATDYVVDNALEHNGSSYRAFVAHTSSAATEPGVGVDWETVWKVVAEKGEDGLPGTTVHNDTTGKQGGGTGEFFHLTQEQNAGIENAPTPVTSANPVITVADAIDTDALLYMMRVIADGGTVEDVAFLDSFFKDAKANNYLDDIVAAYSPSWGVNGTTTASKLYSITGVSSDMVQTTGAEQPLLQPAEQNGKTTLLFDGVDDTIANTSLIWGSTVRTIAIMAFKQIAWTNLRTLSSDDVLGTRIRQVGVTPEIALINDLNDIGIRNSDSAINAATHFRGLFNSTSSAIQINNNIETTGSIGTTQGDGVSLGGTQAGTGETNISMGSMVLLKSVVDGNYAAKMTAIYNFSKSAYGTA